MNVSRPILLAIPQLQTNLQKYVIFIFASIIKFFYPAKMDSSIIVLEVSDSDKFSIFFVIKLQKFSFIYQVDQHMLFFSSLLWHNIFSVSRVSVFSFFCFHDVELCSDLT